MFRLRIGSRRATPTRASRGTALRTAVIALALAIGSQAVVPASPSLAQPAGETDNAGKSEALKAFEEGLELEKQGDYAKALERFQKVGAFKMTPHVRFHIALCEEKLGHLVAALRGFELAAAEANRVGKDAQVVAEKAPGRVDALRKRVAGVRIEVKGTVLYSRVLLDGEAVLQKDWSTLINVDPGTHTIAVDTDGTLSQKKEVTLPEKGYEIVTLEIADKERPAATATVSATVSAPPTVTPPPPVSKLPAFVMGGAGVASLIGAGVLYGLRVGALGSFEEQCPTDKFPPDKDGVQHCPTAAEGARSDAASFTIGAGVMLGVGLAALGGAGAYWLFSQPKSGAQPKPKTSIGVSVAPSGVRLIGQF